MKIGFIENNSKTFEKELKKLEKIKDLVFVKMNKNNDWIEASKFGYKLLESGFTDEVVKSYLRKDKKIYYKELTSGSFQLESKDFLFICHQLENVKKNCKEVQFTLITSSTNPLFLRTVSYSTEAKQKKEKMALFCEKDLLNISIKSINFNKEKLTKEEFSCIFPKAFQEAYQKLAWSEDNI